MESRLVLMKGKGQDHDCDAPFIRRDDAEGWGATGLRKPRAAGRLRREGARGAGGNTGDEEHSVRLVHAPIVTPP